MRTFNKLRLNHPIWKKWVKLDHCPSKNENIIETISWYHTTDLKQWLKCNEKSSSSYGKQPKNLDCI